MPCLAAAAPAKLSHILRRRGFIPETAAQSNGGGIHWALKLEKGDCRSVFQCESLPYSLIALNRKKKKGGFEASTHCHSLILSFSSNGKTVLLVH